MSRRAVLCVVSVAVGLGGAASAGAKDASPLDEIVLWHELRTAFYVEAPRSLAREMRAAIADFCQQPARSDPPWYCGARDTRFFRGVDVLGNKRRSGFACRNFSQLRYYPEDLFEDERNCVAISYDHDAKHHVVESDL